MKTATEILRELRIDLPRRNAPRRVSSAEPSLTLSHDQCSGKRVRPRGRRGEFTQGCGEVIRADG